VSGRFGSAEGRKEQRENEWTYDPMTTICGKSSGLLTPVARKASCNLFTVFTSESRGFDDIVYDTIYVCTRRKKWSQKSATKKGGEKYKKLRLDCEISLRLRRDKSKIRGMLKGM